MNTGQHPPAPTGDTAAERQRHSKLSGTLAAFAAFAAWGVLTAFWKALDHLPAGSVVFQRLFWSLIFLWLILVFRGNWKAYCAAFRSPKTLATHALSGTLIGANWFIFIWATLNEHIVESALGYFLSPLVIIAIGAFFFKEPLNRFQKGAIGLAAIGVGLQLPLLNHFPWVAITLALTFAAYGLVRRQSSLGSLTGLAVETTYFIIPAVLWLSFAPSGGWSALNFSDAGESTLLILSGIVTALPLLWFAHATRTVAFSTIGIIQFLSPSLQFLLGVFVYHEEMNPARLATFALIWIASTLYVLGVRHKHPVAT